jgi:hypothetical protein
VFESPGGFDNRNGFHSRDQYPWLRQRLVPAVWLWATGVPGVIDEEHAAKQEQLDSVLDILAEFGHHSIVTDLAITVEHAMGF